MAHGAPDWVRTFNITVTVPAYDEAAAGDVDRLTTTSTTYASVVSWTVGAGKTGQLKEVSMVSNNYAKTRFKLLFDSDVFMTDITIKTAVTLAFKDLNLAAGTVVTLQAKSSDGTSVTVDGAIVGKEVG